MRNIIIRTITGSIFIIVIVGGLCFHPYLFLSVFSIITGLAVWEFYGLGKSPLWQKIPATAGGVYLFCASFLYASGWASGTAFIPYLLFLMCIFISGLYGKKTANPVQDWANLLLGQVYCAAPFALLNCIVFANAQGGYDSFLVLSLFIFVWINDTGAFLVGSAFGKHRLFERISPKKSWEGFAGGLGLTMVSSFVFAHFYPRLNVCSWLALSVVIVVFATWGDLVESLLKRTIGIKDTGKLLPGHGGVLDRFDSILMAIPALYIFLKLFTQN